ncbi:MAG: tetratricopeptide repeat protein [Candidatus Neomarinimicrobiota bacterium]
MNEQRQTSFWRELKSRRVIQLVGLYLGASWVALEFLNFLTDRYSLSPHLVDLVLVALGAMLPSVLILAYTHGKPGRDQWTFTEKVVLPANAVIMAGLILIFFSGKDLGATTMVVSAEDETGASIERVIPKASFRKQIALFFFTNETGSVDGAWVGRWLPQGLYLDLIQDLYFDNRNPYQMSRAMTEAGAEEGEAPLALMRELARKFHLSYFLHGSVFSIEPYSIETRLYLTKGGRLSASHHYEDGDLGNIIDRVSVDIKRDLGLSDMHIEEVEDLPVAALSSDSLMALAYFIRGLDQLYFRSDWAGAAKSLSAATAIDSSFVHAQFYLYQASLFLGQGSEEAINAAMRYLYKVPERLQGSIKEVYYLYQGEPEKALSALSLDVTLYPEDVLAHRRLANFYNRTGFYAEALKEYHTIRSLNPDDDLVLRDIADVHATLGQFEQALESLHGYARNNPRDTDVLIEMGAVYRLLGQVDEADEVYERALLLGHNPARVMICQSELLFQRGLYGGALARAQEAANVATTPEVRLMALRTLEGSYESLGRIREAMAVAREAMPLERRVYGPMNSVLLRLSHFNKYACTTLADSAEALLAEMSPQLPDPWDRAMYVLQVEFKTNQEGRPISSEERTQVEAFFQEYKFLVEIPRELMMARIHENNGRYRQAIQGYITTLSRYPKRLMVQKYIARAYRRLGDAEAALATINQLLAVYPHDPEVLYELYQIQRLTDSAAAREILTRLTDIWREADRVYLPAREVRRALKRTEAS